jgi:hypothetical protein
MQTRILGGVVDWGACSGLWSLVELGLELKHLLAHWQPHLLLFLAISLNHNLS